MKRLSRGLALAGLLLLSGAARALSLEVCDRPKEPSADQRDVMLRFGAIVRDEIAASDAPSALIASGAKRRARAVARARLSSGVRSQPMLKLPP